MLIIKVEQTRRELKRDFVELSKAKYGIFNIDVWKEEISNIIANKIDEFQFDPENRQELINKLETLLNEGVDLLEKSYKKQRSSSIKGFFQNALTSGIELFDKIRENIPSFAETIVDDLERPETRAQIKKYIKVKIDQYTNETFAQVDYSDRNKIILKYDKETHKATLEHLEGELDASENRSLKFKLAIYIGLMVISLILLLKKSELKLELVTAIIVCAGLLFLGLYLPMIDIDARISRFDLTILDHHIDFENQILYYKSKSILEVVGLMLAQAKLDVAFVGFLVLSFCVLFPMAKLVSSLVVLMNREKPINGIVKFFVFKSGKWSMADVLVVAIFMSYIGFSSILTEQLNQLENVTNSLEVLSTNYSELNTGFFMFFGFVCLSLIISDRINKVPA